MRRGLIGALAALMLVPAGVSTASVAHGEAAERGRALIVKFEAAASPADRAAALRVGGAWNVKAMLLPDTVTLTVAGERGQSAISGARGVEYVEQDGVVHAFGTTNDPGFGSQYGLHNTGQTGGTPDADIDGAEATDLTSGLGVRVDILDTGIDTDHEDLAAKIDCAVNFSSSPTVEDHYGHGTHVAGIAAAITDNSVGVAGTAPDARLCNVKVLSDDGSGSWSGVANGITWSADNGGDVINMSLGGSIGSKTLERAVNHAWNNGVVLVAAAGNSGSQAKSYPAAYTNVIAVAATDHNDQKASFSNYSKRWVDVAAPGVSIYSTMPNHPNEIGPTNYANLSGTSMATPFTAGVAALTWSSPHGTSNSSVRSRLESTADKIAGTDSYWSHGRVNAASAVAP